eukprot:4331145-Pleurochrysis_carterae.AAC.5
MQGAVLSNASHMLADFSSVRMRSTATFNSSIYKGNSYGEVRPFLQLKFDLRATFAYTGGARGLARDRAGFNLVLVACHCEMPNMGRDR